MERLGWFFIAEAMSSQKPLHVNIDLSGVDAHRTGVIFTQPAFTADHGLLYIVIRHKLFRIFTESQLSHYQMRL